MTTEATRRKLYDPDVLRRAMAPYGRSVPRVFERPFQADEAHRNGEVQVHEPCLIRHAEDRRSLAAVAGERGPAGRRLRCFAATSIVPGGAGKVRS